MELDDIKIWESILKELWHWPQKEALVLCIKNALRDQGMQYNSNTKKIESIKPETLRVPLYFRPATPEEMPHSESEQEELNEFEKWFKKLIGCYASAMGTPLIEQPEDRQNDFVKKHAQSLLSIARKQIASEIDVDSIVDKHSFGISGDVQKYVVKGFIRNIVKDVLKAIKGV